MRLYFRYQPLIVRVTIIVMAITACALIYLVFFVRGVAERDPEIQSALDAVDHDAPAALQILRRYIPSDRDNAARAEAIRSFARFIVNDTTSHLDTAVIIALRQNGRQDTPFLGRALLGYGVEACNRGNYQMAVNAFGETAERALTQLSDTLLAARAFRCMGNVYNNLTTYNAAAHNYGVASILFDAINDTTRADLCRLGIVSTLCRTLKADNIELSVAILDSMQPRMVADTQYAEDLFFDFSNLQPRLKARQFEQVISYGHHALKNPDCKGADSLWIYAQLTHAATRSGRFKEAREWLDSTKMFSSHITHKPGEPSLSLVGLEIELLDSLRQLPRSFELHRIRDEETESLIAEYKKRIGYLQPSYTLDAAVPLSGNERKQRIIALLAILTISAIGLICYWTKVSRLHLLVARLRSDNSKIMATEMSLLKSLNEAEERIKSLDHQLEQNRVYHANIHINLLKRVRNLDLELKDSRKLTHEVTGQLQEHQIILNRSQEMVKYLSERLHLAERHSATEIDSKHTIDLIHPYIEAIDSIIRSTDVLTTKNQLQIKSSEKKLVHLYGFLKSESFIQSIPQIASIVEPAFAESEQELKKLLDQDSFLILSMLVAGFSSPSIIAVVEMSSSLFYRKRDAIEDILLESRKASINYLAEKYFQHYNTKNNR